MAETVRLIEPQKLERNPENPRLIFREDELLALQDSIAKQGILVPLTVFHDKKWFYLLDGERRWRCALKLGLLKIPVIVQPKPDRMQNIMMMFAIHNARKDWDPLPTALKLLELEQEFEKRNNKTPTEIELAGIASLRRGEVRRLRKLLKLPEKYRTELLDELKKPRSERQLTVDHVLEATNAAEALRKRKIVNKKQEDELRQAILNKFRKKVIKNTVDPRKLVRVARAVDRNEISVAVAGAAVQKLIHDPNYGINEAFQQTVEKADFEHSIEQLADRLLANLEEHKKRRYDISDSLKQCLIKLHSIISEFLSR